MKIKVTVLPVGVGGGWGVGRVPKCKINKIATQLNQTVLTNYVKAGYS